MIPIRQSLPLILTISHLVSLVIYLLSISDSSRAVTELCNPNKSSQVYQFTFEECPYGVLFALPMMAECLKSSSDNDQSNFYADVCENVKYDPDSSNTIQLIGTITEAELAEADSCKGTGPNQCDLDLKTVGKGDITEPGDDLNVALELNYDEPQEVTDRRNDSLLLDQTFRMFKFIVGLEGDVLYVERKKRSVKDKKGKKESLHAAKHNENENFSNDTDTEDKTYDHEGPNLRIINLLRLSFKILTKHCDIAYVAKAFNRDVQRMFLYLLQETDISQLMDVTVDEYSQIKAALDDCLEKDKAFALNGTACRTYSRVKIIEKNGQTSAYSGDEFSYNSHLHDIPIDATWGTLDFVHGLCYGTFRKHINSHHLFQQAFERIFNNEIVHRWNRPPQLFRPELWDHMLSTNVRTTLQNLDVCIHAAYYDTPFQHRLERPLKHYDGVRSPDPTKAPAVVPGPVVAEELGGLPPNLNPIAAVIDTEGSTTTPDPNAPTKAATAGGSTATADPDAADTTVVPEQVGSTATPDPNAAMATPSPGDAGTTANTNVLSATTATPSAGDATSDASADSSSTVTPAAKRRRKRSNPLSLDDFGLSEAGWCFQSDAQQKKTVRKYIEVNCPKSPALRQFQDGKKKGTRNHEEGSSGTPSASDSSVTNSPNIADSSKDPDATDSSSDPEATDSSSDPEATDSSSDPEATDSSSNPDTTDRPDSSENGDTATTSAPEAEEAATEEPGTESAEAATSVPDPETEDAATSGSDSENGDAVTPEPDSESGNEETTAADDSDTHDSATQPADEEL